MVSYFCADVNGEIQKVFCFFCFAVKFGGGNAFLRVFSCVKYAKTLDKRHIVW